MRDIFETYLTAYTPTSHYKSFNAGDQFGRYRKSLFSHDTGNQPINVTLHMRKPLVRSTSTANR